MDPDGFKIKEIPGKGRGIISTKKRSVGDFLLHYAGEVITYSEGEKRESMSPSGFRFFYYVGKQGFCVDATEESGRLGRLVNHGRKKEINAKMKEINGDLLLFSIRILWYNYSLTKGWNRWTNFQDDKSNIVADRELAGM